MERARKAKLIRELYELDHAFIGKEGVARYTKPFGFMGTTFMARANPQDFKGLRLWDKNGKEISEMEGQDASVTAEEICRHLGIRYQEMFGRGSQLRVCCAALLEFLNEKTTA